LPVLYGRDVVDMYGIKMPDTIKRWQIQVFPHPTPQNTVKTPANALRIFQFHRRLLGIKKIVPYISLI